MQGCEIIERCNLPLNQLFGKDALLLENVERLLEEELVSIGELSSWSRTFRQLMLIDKGNGLSAAGSNAIMKLLEERDAQEPIYMYEVYPYLQEDYWELNMSEISYFKIHVQNACDWSITLERIEKGYDPEEQKTYLNLFPFEEEEESIPMETDTMNRCYRVYFDENGSYEHFMKMILLDGMADLSKV